MLNDPVNHLKHYTSHPSGVECITITRHMGFNLGNALKYIWRADLKGNSIEDLRKAIWYIEDEIKKRGGVQQLINITTPGDTLSGKELKQLADTLQQTIEGFSPPPGVREPDNRPPAPPAPCMHNHDSLEIEHGDEVACIKCGALVTYDASTETFSEVFSKNTSVSLAESEAEELDELPGFTGEVPKELLDGINSSIAELNDSISFLPAIDAQLDMFCLPTRRDRKCNSYQRLNIQVCPLQCT